MSDTKHSTDILTEVKAGLCTVKYLPANGGVLKKKERKRTADPDSKKANITNTRNVH